MDFSGYGETYGIKRKPRDKILNFTNPELSFVETQGAFQQKYKSNLSMTYNKPRC